MVSRTLPLSSVTLSRTHFCLPSASRAKGSGGPVQAAEGEASSASSMRRARLYPPGKWKPRASQRAPLESAAARCSRSQSTWNHLEHASSPSVEHFASHVGGSDGQPSGSASASAPLPPAPASAFAENPSIYDCGKGHGWLHVYRTVEGSTRTPVSSSTSRTTQSSSASPGSTKPASSAKRAASHFTLWPSKTHCSQWDFTNVMMQGSSRG
mmetsp:Transcript_15678/g.48742  ORF Transcript_15678/g.48742 Transcript_15678/m.48742 type:complete len:211 (+) Transcript_15678:363-995(+)